MISTIHWSEALMLRNIWNRFGTFEGRASRKQYMGSALFLVAIKYLADFFIASHFGVPWKLTAYVLPPHDLTIFGINGPHSTLYLILWAVAIPFFWAGVSLTLRRLRDAGQRLGWLFLFFLPIANFLLFLFLSLAPSRSNQIETDSHPDPASPKSWLRPLLGLFVSAAIGVALVRLGANTLFQYGWGMFLGIPFITGFLTSWIMNSRTVQSRRATIVACVGAPAAIGIALFGLRMEGVICLLMATPLALPFSIAGGLVARGLLIGPRKPVPPPAVTACVAVIPLLMFVEHTADLQPPVKPVVTSIIVNAPVEVVWKHVITFPPIPPPQEWIFHTGIAYPIGATIKGSGPGAIRYCQFSTGDFVEPITTWDENRLLAFTVAAEPPSMEELSWSKISTPHIERNYMRSRHGQFRLVALDSRHTLLEGTTWYQDYFWPQIYWRPLSDSIIHRIHLRVLEQVKSQAEVNITSRGDDSPVQ
jgi:uncharacterized membrane protein YhaH (DUF805 family)